MHKLSALLLPLLIAGPAVARSTPPSPPMHRVSFDFHSAFLMNLHHFLYDMAVHKDRLAGVQWQTVPTSAEMDTLREAVAFYRSHYAELALLDDATMVGIKRALSVDDARRSAAGLALPPGLAAVLDSVAPIYERGLWSLHDRSNRSWIAQARALDIVFGAEVQAGIERHLGAPFPTTPIRDDIVFSTGTRQGAYTDEQIVMPSSRADYSGLAALEMLYHEASHTTVTVPLEAAIDARLKATGRKDDLALWHVTQFYTVGKVTQDVFAKRGIAYRSYADQRGLYTGFWAPLMPVVEAVWLPHMDGKLNLQESVNQMVDRLPAP
jgi:hypothetical protein